MNKTKKAIVNVGGDVIPAVGASVAGAAIGGPIGAVVGGLAGLVSPVVKDMLSRALSVKEKERIEIVAEIAKQKIDEHIKLGHSLRKDFNKAKSSELFEGALLKAKNTYETKKLPLIANLFAKAPFTNTPLENMNQTLIHAEQLSYRQLCILSIIGENEFDKKLGLSDKPYMHESDTKKYDEMSEGIYQDILSMIQLGILYQPAGRAEGGMYINFSGYVVPNNLVFSYPGRLLYNGLELDQIPQADKEIIITVLRPSR